MENTLLKGSNLQNSNLSGNNLSKIDFSNADLSQADLSGTDLSETSFNKANLKNTNFEGAILLNTLFVEVNLSETNNFGKGSTELSNFAITFSKIKDVNFPNLSATNFYKSEFYDVDFSEKSVIYSWFSRANLNEINFEGSDFSGCPVIGKQ